MAEDQYQRQHDGNRAHRHGREREPEGIDELLVGQVDGVNGDAGRGQPQQRLQRIGQESGQHRADQRRCQQEHCRLLEADLGLHILFLLGIDI